MPSTNIFFVAFIICFSGDGFRRVAPVPGGRGCLNVRPHSLWSDPETPVRERGDLARLLRQLDAGGGDEQRRDVEPRAGELRGLRGGIHHRRSVPAGLRRDPEFVGGVREERGIGRRRKRRVGVRRRRDASLQCALLPRRRIRVRNDTDFCILIGLELESICLLAH